MKDATAINYVQFPTMNQSVFFPVKSTPIYLKWTAGLTTDQLVKFRKALSFVNRAPDFQLAYAGSPSLYKDIIQEAILYALDPKPLALKEWLASLRRKYWTNAQTTELENTELLEVPITADYHVNSKGKVSYKNVPLYIPEKYLDWIDSLPLSRAELLTALTELIYRNELELDTTTLKDVKPKVKKSVSLPLLTYYRLRALDLKPDKLLWAFCDKYCPL